MTADLSQFYQVFFEETAEHLAGMEKLLLGLDVSHPNMDNLNAIFRAAHSIKGGAGTFGFNDMAEVTHILETLLDRLRKQEMALNAEMVKIINQPDVQERLATLAFTPVGDSRAQFAAYIKSEIAKWGKAVKDSGAKVD